MKVKGWFVGFVIGLVPGIIIGIVLLAAVGRPKPVNLSDSQNWLLIREYRGVLDPSEGEAKVQVSAISRWSGEGGGETIQQNKIELTKNNHSVTFMWPDQKEYAGGRCEILDLNNDGLKEFAFFDNSNTVRIVSYSHGAYQFRRKVDELFSVEFGSGPTDLKNDGRLEFVSSENFPESQDGERIEIPHVMIWSETKGFADVSSEFGSYYATQILPALRERTKRENNGQIQHIYLDAIKYIETKLVPSLAGGSQK